MALGDLNGDARPDLVTSETEGLVVRFANGSGGFSAPTSYSGSPSRIAIADLDHDQHGDVISTEFNAVSVRLGSATGALSAPVSYASPGAKFRLAIADLDGDGNLDVAAMRPTIGSVQVLFGMGDGTLRNEEVHGAGYAVGTAAGLAVGDFDHNGRPDLVAAAGAVSGRVTILLNRLPGTTAVGPPPRQLAHAFDLHLQPNPARGSLRAAFVLPSPGRVRLELLDIAGRVVIRREHEGQLGPQSVRLGDARGIRPGVYLLRMEQRGRRATTRAVVLE